MPHRRQLSDTRQNEIKVSNFGQKTGHSVQRNCAAGKTGTVSLLLIVFTDGDFGVVPFYLDSHGI
jgi:hypothetical protein